MIYYILLLVSITLSVCKSSLYNSYAKKTSSSLFSTFCFNGVTYFIAAVIAGIMLLFNGSSFSVPTVWCALCYAIIVFLLQTISVTAMRCGNMALTSICVMYGMIIPSLAGPVFWHEPFNVLQGIGIVMMIASLWLLGGNGKIIGESLSPKWIVLAVAAFILSGMAGIVEKIHQSTEARMEKPTFILFACLFMLAFSLLASLVTYRKEISVPKPKIIIGLGGLAGITVGFYSMVNLTLAGALNSMIYYPVANGGALVLTIIVSRIMFKEALDLRKGIGCAIGCIGIICLSLPI
jgi:drug/metabolite transporter (DMT)-like permease